MTHSPDLLPYYTSYGKMTDPGDFSWMLEDLPDDIASLCQVVQNNLIHVFWAERYGVHLAEEQKQTLNVRKIQDKLHLISAADPRPLTIPRDIRSRQVGNCRDFTLFTTAILRHKGIPARARCGFGRYFLPGQYEDHWVCEYWDKGQNRWIMVDSQLDSYQMGVLELAFDPLDVPDSQFITGGRAWQMCRRGEARPDQFGIFDMRGWWFIWGDVIRDFLSLNKIEILPWDGGWGYLVHDLGDAPPEGTELDWCDRIASLSADPYANWVIIRSIFEGDPGFLPPSEL